MPRNKPITEEEIIWSAVRFREAPTLRDLGLAIREVFLEIFKPEKTYFYYMFGGRLFIPFEACYGLEQFKESILDVMSRVRVYDPLEARLRGRLVHHSSEVYQWHEEKPGMTQKAFEEGLSLWGLDWEIGAYYLDQDLLLACAGVGRPYDLGDYSEFDLEAMQALYPHIDAALKACFEAERVRRFGTAIAAALEHHPCALYVFEGSEMTFANFEGRLLITRDTVDSSPEWPLWNRSPGVKALAEHVAGAQVSLPTKFSNARFITLPHGIQAGQPPAVLVMIEPVEIDLPALTATERRVLEARRSYDSVDAAASSVGITAATMRTHLRNAYRKFGVSNLNEALVLYSLMRSPAPQFES